MTEPLNYPKLFTWWMGLVAAHSFCIGLGLIFLPAGEITRLGFTGCTERFFPFQGGVFHLLMSAAYWLAGTAPERFAGLVRFSILVKFTAFVLLLVYYFAVDQILMVLLSALVDGVLGWITLGLAHRSGLLSPLPRREVRHAGDE